MRNVLKPSEYFKVSQIFSTFALPPGLISGGRHIIGSAFRIFIPLSETSTTSINMTGMRIGSTPLACIFVTTKYCQGEAEFYLNVILAVEGHTQVEITNEASLLLYAFDNKKVLSMSTGPRAYKCNIYGNRRIENSVSQRSLSETCL